MLKTKIICTLGPSTDNERVLESLVVNGMSVARLNFSHGTHEMHKKRIDALNNIMKIHNKHIPTMLDTKGPEIRTGFFPKRVFLEQGMKVTISNKDIEGSSQRFSITSKNLHKHILIGQRILIDDGLVELKVDNISKNGDIECTVINAGEVSSNKGINLPDCKIDMPSLTEADIEDIKFAIENDIDFIALSFVKSAHDVVAVRKLLEKLNGKDIRIIAKIENRQGVDNADEIIKVSDGIMIARGDLGIEIPVEDVPIVQKLLIKKCYAACKPVITATQMLDSMMRNPRPTRAEASDVANAIFDGTSCIMLSGETAAGKYPVESLMTMVSIAENTENNIHYWNRFTSSVYDIKTVTDAISHATCTTAMNLKAAAIATVTKNGRTARRISRYRPECPIIAVTTDAKVLRQLNLSWGVYPFQADEVNSTDRLFDIAISASKQSGIAQDGDLVIITAGVPVGVSGTTNILKVQMVGNTLCSGIGVSKGIAIGELCVSQSDADIAENFSEGQILVVDNISDALLPLLRKAKGIIIEDNDEDGTAARVGIMLDIPVIKSAYGATNTLKSGTCVMMDGERGIVWCEECSNRNI